MPETRVRLQLSAREQRQRKRQRLPCEPARFKSVLHVGGYRDQEDQRDTAAGFKKRPIARRASIAALPPWPNKPGARADRRSILYAGEDHSARV